MALPPKSLRLRPEIRAAVERIARRTRRSFSEVTQDLLEEALRMRMCPGIYFADEPAGRVAKVSGTGLGVWEVMRDYLAVKGKRRQLRKILPHLSDAQLEASVLYYRRYPEEIDAEIAENATLVAARPEVRYPTLRRRR